MVRIATQSESLLPGRLAEAYPSEKKGKKISDVVASTPFEEGRLPATFCGFRGCHTIDASAMISPLLSPRGLPCRCRTPSFQHLVSSQVRTVSSSPYGRTHVWKRRAPALPNPVVPKFPQLVIRSDGTSFTHWTTSPRSTIRLTRDTTNNPVWNTGAWSDDRGVEEESAMTGRLGRFNRRFEELGQGQDEKGAEWMDSLVESGVGSGGELWTGSVVKKKQKSK
ncbi:hypothetical protein LshimejAT787_1601920 [Lyophyllum shimeji]|uniref:Uncharacterized protein n=1 Tax=Lyophyllum shimeji TaxID=47721 RepID=A0A9P3UTJ7_LYOSH|nr:hypothetical protein LshimejAT787_1601920 [Lyophyllum shimeji]